MHRTVENANRKATAKIAFGSIYKSMDESPEFIKFLESKVSDKGSVESQKKKYAQAYAKNMVLLNHFDYNSYAKARNMREGVGQFAFQFQHYGMEFLERNWSILKEAKGDLSELPNDSFSNWVKDARGVHKTMNMGVAYFLAPALLSYMSGYNQTLIEHVGVEMLEDMKLLLFSDWDDEEDLELMQMIQNQIQLNSILMKYLKK